MPTVNRKNTAKSAAKKSSKSNGKSYSYTVTGMMNRYLVSSKEIKTVDEMFAALTHADGLKLRAWTQAGRRTGWMLAVRGGEVIGFVNYGLPVDATRAEALDAVEDLQDIELEDVTETVEK